MTKDKSPDQLMPQLRFPEFRGNPSWDTAQGNELFESVSNRANELDLPVLAITQEHGAVPRDEIDYHVSVSNKSIENYKEVCPGDFIISLRSFQGGIEYSKYHGVCSPAYIILRKIGDGATDFYRHLFKTDRYITQLTRNLEGLRDGKMISYKQFSAVVHPVPSPAEQRKIAECLGSLDDWIAAETEELAALRRHKTGLMQQLFPPPGETRPRLRFPEFRDAGEWKRKPLKRIAENLDSKRVPITGSNRQPGKVPYYGASGVVDYVEGHLFDEPLLCVSEDGANLLARTYPIAFGISGKTWVNNHAHVLRFQSQHTQTLVEEYLNSIDLKDFITGMAQPKLNRANLDAIPILLPVDLAEQSRIADCLISLNAHLSGVATKLDTLRQHKCGLMQNLFPAVKGQHK